MEKNKSMEVKLDEYKKEQNEKFFLQTLDFLSEGGKYIFKDYPKCIYTKRDGKFVCGLDSYGMIRPLVSQEFIKKYFYFTDE